MRLVSEYLVAAGLLSSTGVVVAQNNNNSTDKDHYRISAGASNNCALLDYQCSGSQTTLRVETPSGFYITAQKFEDNGAYRPLDRSIDILDTLHLQAQIDRKENASGYGGVIGYKFKLGQDTGLNVEMYAVKGSASGELTAQASAKLDAGAADIPSASLYGQSIPGTHIEWAAQNKNWAYKPYGTAAQQGMYGGLREVFGISFDVQKNIHVIANQFGQFGVDRMYYGVGVGGVYTSESESGVGRKFASLCQDGAFSSSSRIAIGFAVCGKKVTKDVLYDKLLGKTQRIADQINAYGARVQDTSESVAERTGYGVSIPQVTGEQVADSLGISSPYNKVHMSAIFAVSVKPSRHTFVTASMIKAQNHKVAADLTVGFEF